MKGSQNHANGSTEGGATLGACCGAGAPAIHGQLPSGSGDTCAMPPPCLPQGPLCPNVMCRSRACTMRTSPGSISPAVRRTQSPGTTSAWSTCRSSAGYGKESGETCCAAITLIAEPRMPPPHQPTVPATACHPVAERRAVPLPCRRLTRQAACCAAPDDSGLEVHHPHQLGGCNRGPHFLWHAGRRDVDAIGHGVFGVHSTACTTQRSTAHPSTAKSCPHWRVLCAIPCMPARSAGRWRAKPWPA